MTAQRARMLEVAASEFARGYLLASVDDVARESSMIKPHIYACYRSKDELYEAVLDKQVVLLEHKVVVPLGLLEPLSLEELATATVQVVVAYAEAEAAGLELLFGSRDQARSARYRALSRAVVRDAIAVQVEPWLDPVGDGAESRNDLVADAVLLLAVTTAELVVQGRMSESGSLRFAWCAARGLAEEMEFRAGRSQPAAPEERRVGARAS